MAKGANQKSKLLVLYQLLLERTDEENPLTTQQLIDHLEQKRHRGRAKEHLRRHGDFKGDGCGHSVPEGAGRGLVHRGAGL